MKFTHYTNISPFKGEIFGSTEVLIIHVGQSDLVCCRTKDYNEDEIVRLFHLGNGLINVRVRMDVKKYPVFL